MSKNTHTTDVIVIGGGVIGLSVADALRREKLSVTLLERGYCGREASWAGAGILHFGSCHRRDPLVQLHRESVTIYPDYADDLRDRTGIDCEYNPCGNLDILLEDQQLRMARSEVKAALAFQGKDGCAALELLTPEQTRQIEPALTDKLLGAKHCPLSGQIRNPRLLKALLEGCRRGGVEIIEESEAKELVTKDDRVTGVRTASSVRQAGHVILAAGCWSSLLDERLAHPVPVVPVRGQIVLLRVARPLIRHVVERGRCYLVPRRDGHVILGATQEPDAGFEKCTTVAGIASLLNMGLRLVPDLADATIVQTWAGLRPGTPDSRPYIGPVPGMAGLIAATGHFRCGLTLAPVTARIVADLVTRGQTARDLSRCQPGRPLEDRVAATAGA